MSIIMLSKLDVQQTVVDVGMNTAALILTNYLGVNDQIANFVGVNSAVSRAVASGITAETTRVLSNLAYNQWPGYMLPPTPVGSTSDILADVVLDSVSMYALDKFDLLGVLNQYIGEGMVQDSFKQALVIEGASVVSRTLKGSGVLEKFETSVKSFL